ncbi:hypothetical protein I0C86_08920 [Plantactinospora sp. S1510]|uniref:Uncharacterized protein n=1 Tax=Plantactinospora alkalitolerans TaxID=2789879 RepID=A0ABS0GT79_9ACTN|nr:hypothetical protein [Plantactinospora alkalitolerans]MBF9129102.1 hypothetical protein [Plantactinospora alkalitolerans]
MSSTDDVWTSDDDVRPEETLAELDRLRTRTRTRTHSGAWLPAALVALLLLASSALYRAPFAQINSLTIDHPYWAGLPDEQRHPVLSYAFWFVAIPLLVVVTAAWYARRARQLGVRVAWPVFAATGLGVLLLLAIVAAVPKTKLGSDGMTADLPTWWWQGLLTPLLPVAAAVLALAWAERSPGLAASGLWITLLTVWLCGTLPLGHIPSLVIGLMDGGTSSYGGQLALRPGHYLGLMALPLVVFAVVRGARAWRLHHA